MTVLPSNDSAGNSENLNPVKGIHENIEARFAEASGNGATPPLTLVHETTMPDADEFADEMGSAETDDETAARASALRAILIDGLDEKKIEWRIKRQWSRLKDVSTIIKSAQRTAEKWKPGAIRVIGGMQKRIASIESLNDRFVMVAVPGQPSCVAQISDALFLARDDFKARLGDSAIVTGVDQKGAVKAQDAAKVWLGDCRRRAANKIVFTSRKVGRNCLNLWTGFGVTPKAGKCDLIKQHVHKVICAGRDQENKAFLDLLAWQVQNIGRASRIIVDLFSKAQQTGKGVLLEKILTPMFGLHGMFTADAGKAFGRFNDAIRGKVYAAFDEACFAGDKQLADKIKSASGTETTAIEGKNVPVISCPTATNYYMCTNRPHSAHIEWDDARYWILKVSDHRKGDDAYWADLIDEIENGGREAFLYDLLARDVSNFIPQRDVPRDNEEHRANKRASDPAHPGLWLVDCIDNGLWLGSEKWEGKYSVDGIERTSKGAISMVCGEGAAKMLPAFIEDAYRAWAAAQGRRAQAVGTSEFWKHLTEFGLATGKSNGKRYRAIPAEKELRDKIVERLGGEWH